MGLLQKVFGGLVPGGAGRERIPQATGDAYEMLSLDDPRLREIMRGVGDGTISPERALRNPAVFRSVSLIAGSIGMLPLHLKSAATSENATDHPLFKILHRRPNAFQSAFDFRSLMQLRALVHGNAYALVVRSRDLRSGRDKIAQLVPLDAARVTPKLDEMAWTAQYVYQAASGGSRVYSSRDVFHLRGLSIDGLSGLSLVRQAADAISLAGLADRAVNNLFRKGTFVGGVLSVDGELSPAAYDRLKASWAAEYAGADNAGKTPVLEGGTKYTPVGATARDSQANETRARQVEEIGRVFGIPRPLLMVDETSWGSGIDVLGQFFVRYALSPWFEAWQQAAERTLLDDDEQDMFDVKFNAGGLLRGSMKDMAEFFAKALGSGGHRPWMEPNEVRSLMDQPSHPDGNGLRTEPTGV